MSTKLVLRDTSLIEKYKNNHKLLEVLKKLTSKDENIETYYEAFNEIKFHFPDVLSEILHQYLLKHAEDEEGIISAIAQELNLL